MTLTLFYLATFGFVALLLMALVPRPSVQMPRLAGILLMSPGRHVVGACLSWVGKLMPRTGDKDKGEPGRERLPVAGSTLTQEEFIGAKILSAVGGCLVGAVIAREFAAVSWLWLTLAGAIGFAAPDLWRQARIRRRRKALVGPLPEVIDLLSLCVGAGLDFLVAISKVVEVMTAQRRGAPRGALLEELSVVSQEVKLGKRRSEALKAMARRANTPEISSFVRTLTQADRMGTPIMEALAIHAEDVRFQRFNRAERAALKAPIKILFPLIFCIMPCVAIVVGAPIFIQFVRQNPFGQ
jgi:tight adherence protein C